MMAERELSAFFNAVTQLFGSEQAELSAKDWLQELMVVEGLPASTREWRLITAKASTRLASRLSVSSLSTEFINASA
jgi:alkylhydroperoxidase/carboxymuconolactone decarboxylase family protein YurZ